MYHHAAVQLQRDTALSDKIAVYKLSGGIH